MELINTLGYDIYLADKISEGYLSYNTNNRNYVNTLGPLQYIKTDNTLLILGTNEFKDLRHHLNCKTYFGLHRGWANLALRVRKLGKDVDVFAGHSYGAAIAAILASIWKAERAVLFAPPRFCTKEWYTNCGVDLSVYRCTPHVIDYLFPEFMYLPGVEYKSSILGSLYQNHSIASIVNAMKQTNVGTITQG